MASAGATLGVAVPALVPLPAAAAGVVTEYTAGLTPLSGINGVTAGPDGNVWFTQNAIDRIGRVTPSGTITEFSAGISADAHPWDIAAGADGNLWFTATGVDPSNVARIGRITPSGAVTEFTAGLTANARPLGITTGPDGNVWFVEHHANKIGRITPAGIITEFGGITADAQLAEIATGPDGNLWFTENLSNKIGKITPTGTVTEFTIPTATSHPTGITGGPDGNVWFVEGDGNKVGRITPAGVITEFPIPTANTQARAITSGPDGNLWYTGYFTNRVGRITTGGVFTEFTQGISPLSFPSSITAGPDGNVWFGELGPTNRIAKITTGPDTPGVVSRFFGTQPKRVLDSRDGTGGFSTPWGNGTTRSLTVTGGATTVPADATAVVMNVTGVKPSTTTHVTLWPAGQPKPDASNINLPPGSVRPNLVVVKVGTAGKVSIFNNSGTIDLLADIVGYFRTDNAGVLYNGLTPHRILDTRDGTGGFATTWGPATTREVAVAGGATTVPPGAAAVMLNVTVTNPTVGSHLTLWPAGQPMPDSSNLNFDAGETVANAVVVKTGTDGNVAVFNNKGTTHVIADVVGYYATSGGVYTPITPHRLLDSRNGTGGYSTPWTGALTRPVIVSGGATTVPPGATAVVVNLTGIKPSEVTHVSAWPDGIPMPVASNLNLPGGDIRANLAVIKIGAGNKVSLYNNSGSIDLLGDVVGYYQ